MARCRITKPSTLLRLSKTVGFAVLGALTRGGTGHRIDCWGHPDDPSLVYFVHRDGTVEKSDIHVHVKAVK